jgi:predicted membrane channel-forming protein YqfA (hemolysin III family)
MGFLLKSHQHFRWLVVLVAIVAVLGFLVTWLQRKDSKLDRILMAIFTGCLDLQWLMGAVLFVLTATSSGLTRKHWEHAFTLTLALVLAHLSAKWKTAPTAIRARNYLFISLGVIALIVAGVAVYPTGWQMG